MNYPSLCFDHLKRLTDDTGLLQHALWTTPDPNHGYTLDDNARALVVALRGHEQTGCRDLLELARRYLGFMLYSQRDDGNFRNFAGYDRRWLEDSGSQDSIGRALWALGYCLHHAPEAGMRDTAMWMFDRAKVHITGLTSPRAVAAAILGCDEAISADRNAGLMLRVMDQSASYLLSLYEQVARGDWQWYEESVTYGNATLSQAMLTAGAVTGEKKYHDVGVRSLEFLIAKLFLKQVPGDSTNVLPPMSMETVPIYLDLIGQAGWLLHGGPRAEFDQQPIDAVCMVEALLVAERTCNEPRFGELAVTALDWFYGKNRLCLPLYDQSSGGCFDALIADGVNRNQGAESTLAHLSARLVIGADDQR